MKVMVVENKNDLTRLLQVQEALRKTNRTLKRSRPVTNNYKTLAFIDLIKAKV